MTTRNEIDRFFDRLLPSATAAEVESGRQRVLERIRDGVAAGARTAPEWTGRGSVRLSLSDYLILSALSSGERHGYAIMKEVEAATDGAAKFGPGTFHTCIARLLANGWIEESELRADPGINDELRQYYRLTGMGATAFSAETERLSAASSRVNDIRVVRPI
jgi:DNA-binding PadR family transcriptional regulator